MKRLGMLLVLFSVSMFFMGCEKKDAPKKDDATVEKKDDAATDAKTDDADKTDDAAKTDEEDKK